jgi:hypothetical protein
MKTKTKPLVEEICDFIEKDLTTFKKQIKCKQSVYDYLYSLTKDYYKIAKKENIVIYGKTVASISAANSIYCTMRSIKDGEDFNIKKHTYSHDTASFINNLHQFGSWRLTKRIYSFDETVQDELFSTNSMDINSDVLFNLPDYCVCIDLKNKKINGKEYDSFLASISESPNDGNKKNLQLGFIEKNFGLSDENFEKRDDFDYKPKVMSVPLNKGNITEAFEHLMEVKEKESGYTVFLEDSFVKKQHELIRVAVSHLMYLCQEQPDYTGGFPTCYVRNRVKLNMKLEPPRKSTVIRVGESVGARIRQAYTLEETSQGKRVRAHIRRGHFHSFWKGKLESEERRLFTKWLHPMVVNGSL